MTAPIQSYWIPLNEKTAECLNHFNSVQGVGFPVNVGDMVDFPELSDRIFRVVSKRISFVNAETIELTFCLDLIDLVDTPPKLKIVK